MQDEWYNVFIAPMVQYYPMVLISMSACFLIQWGSHYVSAFLFPKRFGGLSKVDQLDWCVRVVAISHAVVSWGSIPSLFYETQIQGTFNEAGVVVYDHYAFSSIALFYFQIGTGYFLWDIIVSLYYNWGPIYIVHGFLSFGVLYFSLYPFLHYWGRFYHGIFEISTPWIHLRSIMDLAKYTGFFYTLCEGLFALSFSIVRVFLGVYVSYYWWLEMINLIVTEQAHSNIVIIYYLSANFVLMGLQVYWFILLVKGAFGADVSDKTKAE